MAEVLNVHQPDCLLNELMLFFFVPYDLIAFRTNLFPPQNGFWHILNVTLGCCPCSTHFGQQNLKEVLKCAAKVNKKSALSWRHICRRVDNYINELSPHCMWHPPAVCDASRQSDVSSTQLSFDQVDGILRELYDCLQEQLVGSGLKWFVDLCVLVFLTSDGELLAWCSLCRWYHASVRYDTQ
jgi:hypothetical protein